MASRQSDPSKAAKVVRKRSKQLSRLHDTISDLRDRVMYASTNVQHQRSHVQEKHRTIMEKISGLVRNLRTVEPAEHDQQLAEIETLHQQLWSSYTCLDESVSKLMTDEEELSRLEYKSRTREMRLQKASKKLLKTLEPVLDEPANDGGVTTDGSDSLLAGSQASAQVPSTMHPKQEEYYHCVAIEQMMLERYQFIRDEYDDEDVSRGLLRDQGEDVAVSDEDFELNRRNDLLSAVEECDRAAQLVDEARNECFAMGLQLDTGVERPPRLEDYYGSEVGSFPPFSPAMSGIDLQDRPLSHLPFSLLYGGIEPAVPEPISKADARRARVQRVEDIGQWIAVTQDSVSEIDPQLVRQSPAEGADWGDMEKQPSHGSPPSTDDTRGGICPVAPSKHSGTATLPIMSTADPPEQYYPNPQIVLPQPDAPVTAPKQNTVREGLFGDYSWLHARSPNEIGGENSTNAMPSPMNLSPIPSQTTRSQKRLRRASDSELSSKSRQDSHQDETRLGKQP